MNAIRARAGIKPLQGLGATALIQAIAEENRVEFALENHRWYDLLRTGRAQQVLNISSVNRLLLPIPFAQVSIDPDLQQNPGLD